ncbi:MAG: 2OG-Fe(II) oxygenase, partial [Polaromonas sp.]|nr:2OG-Fe(II) oxygenase [Polaromonas sp.]
MSSPATNSQHPVISRELRQWIAEQTAEGHGRDAVLQAMLAAGWSHQVASEALTETPPAPVPVPWPAAAASSLRLDAGDRQVAISTVMRTPDLLVLENLLDSDECLALIAAARPRLQRSLTVALETGGEEVHDDRTSDGMFFTRGETGLVATIEARIAKLLDWPVENGEGLQVLRYGPGAEYKPHYDYFDPAEPGSATILARGGQRVATLVIYLQEPDRGGATVFPDLRLQVAPRRGSAVF